jgi:hypothetical protein
MAAGKPHLACACGRDVWGNAGIASHRKACQASLERDGWPLDAGMTKALREEYPRNAVPTILYVSRQLGRVYIERRRAGDKTGMPWREYRDLVWQLAAEAQPRGPRGAP